MPAANVEQFVKDRVCESMDFMRYLLKIITINVLNLNYRCWILPLRM